MRTSYNVHGAGQAAQRQVGADKDGSWRQDRMTSVTEREQQHPQLQQQEATRGGPGALITSLRISPRHDRMHACFAHGRQRTGRCSWNQQEPITLHYVMDVGGTLRIISGSRCGWSKVFSRPSARPSCEVMWRIMRECISSGMLGCSPSTGMQGQIAAAARSAHRVGQGGVKALLQAAKASARYGGCVEGHLCGQVQELSSQGIQVGNGQRRLPSQLRKVLHQDAIQDLRPRRPASDHCFAEGLGGSAGILRDTLKGLHGFALLNLPHHTKHETSCSQTDQQDSW